MTGTVISAEGSGIPRECPCGADHRPPPRRRRPLREPSADLPAKVLPLLWAGKAHQDASTAIWTLEVSGDCSSPLTVRQHSLKPDLRAKYRVRCRKCGPCRRAMRNYWGFAAMNQTLEAAKSGHRTWFGTLTCDASWQGELLTRAIRKAPAGCTADWKNPMCEERYRRVSAEFLREVQKYWKRLRNAGHAFKYIVVFEPHESGLPHAHFLLHEQDGTILQRSLKAEWPCGFTRFNLVGGRARNAAAPNRAAWYVVKYLTKATQTRLRASKGYIPELRFKDHATVGPKSLRREDRVPSDEGKKERAKARDAAIHGAPRGTCDDGVCEVEEINS